MSCLRAALHPLLMLSAFCLHGALSQPRAFSKGGLTADFSQYADRWTLSRTGCTCQFDFTRRDCACCIVGGAQCPIGSHNVCVKCGQEYTCGIPHPVIKDRVVNGWTGAMECPCPGNSGRDTCACCINGGCPCANDPYHCTECGTIAGCGDGKNTLPDTIPLGVSSGRIPDSQMSASSYIDHHMGPHRARLNVLPSDAGAGGWSPLELNRDQYLQIDLVYPTIITGVATQGRAGNSDEWVTSYNLAHSMDGSNWNFYGGDREGVRNSRGMLFKGNSDCDEIVHHNLEEPVNARYVRFLPQDYYNRIGMRVELYGHEPEVPVGTGGGIQNLALYKPAEQSSMFEPIFGASGAVDGKDDEGVVITKVQTQPWWSVDLQDHYQIYFVAINNPGIMLCAEPKILTHFVVRVGDNPDVNNNPPCSAIYRRKVEPGESVQVQCQSIDGVPPVGRYVSIQLNPDKPDELTHLQVSEVKVYGVARPVPGPTCQIKEGVHYLGMESGEINGAQITASIYLKGYQPQNARLNLHNQAWVAECHAPTRSLARGKHYHLTIDLLALTDVEGLLTQGSLVPEESYVSQFTMETSVDGKLFLPYKAADGTVKLFQSNMDGTDIVCHLLPSQICVRAIKIIPISWHRCVAMRVELLGYRVQHVEPAEMVPTTELSGGETTADQGTDLGKPSADKPNPLPVRPDKPTPPPAKPVPPVADQGEGSEKGKPSTPVSPANQAPTAKPALPFEPEVPEVTTSGGESGLEFPTVRTTLLVPVEEPEASTSKPAGADLGVATGKPAADIPIPTLAPKAAPAVTTLQMEAETEMPEDKTTVLAPVADSSLVTRTVVVEASTTAKPASAVEPAVTTAESETELGIPTVQTTPLVPDKELEPTTPQSVGTDLGAATQKPAADNPIPTPAPKSAPVVTTVKNDAETKISEEPSSYESNQVTAMPVEVTSEQPTQDIVLTTPGDEDAGKPTSGEQQGKSQPKGQKKKQGRNKTRDRGRQRGKDKRNRKGKEKETEIGESSTEAPNQAPVTPAVGPTTPGMEEEVDEGKPGADEQQDKPKRKGKKKRKGKDKNRAKDKGSRKGKDKPKRKGKRKGTEVEEPATEEPNQALTVPALVTTSESFEAVASTTPGIEEEVDEGKPGADEQQDKPKRKGKKGEKKRKGKDKNRAKDKGSRKGKDKPKRKGKKKGTEVEEPATEEPNQALTVPALVTTAEPVKAVASTTPGMEEEVDQGKPGADEQQDKPKRKGKKKRKGKDKNRAKDKGGQKGKDKPKRKGKKKGTEVEEPATEEPNQAVTVPALVTTAEPVEAVVITSPVGSEVARKPADDEGIGIPALGKDKGQDKAKDQLPKTLATIIDTVEISSFKPGYNPASGDGSWVAATEDDNQFLDMTFEDPVDISDLTIAPVLTDEGEAIVTALELLYQQDGSGEFLPVSMPDGRKIFTLDDAEEGPNGKLIFKLPFTIRTQRIRLLPRKWKGQIGMKIVVLGQETEPRTFTLGNFISNIRSSSYVPGYNPTSGKGAWLAAISDKKQFLQVTFDSPKEIKKVQVTPLPLEKGKVAMVTKFKIFYRSPKETELTLYKFPSGKDVFNVKDARGSKEGVQTFKLRQPIIAKDLRIVPLEWRNRIGFTLNLIGRKPRETPQRDEGKPQKDKGKPKKAPRRLSPVRLTFAPSSIYKDYNPTTSSTSLWVPDPKDLDPFLMVTFDQEVILTSIQARGKKIPKLGGEGWIKEFRLQLMGGGDDESWGDYTLEDGSNILAFDPVVDRAYKKTSFNFPEDVNVSQLKFYPVSWEKFAAIRMQLWGYYKEKRRKPKGGRRLTLYYLLWKTDASWEDAQAYCSKDNGQLAKITDASVQDTIVQSIIKSGFKADWWIGVTDKKLEGTWLCSDDTSLDYTNWIGGEKPDLDESKNCAFLQ
ncbi:uncharacterized protein LOC110985369 [Acanthaster planci]|uniref:Uncharacterized protein LOC110985369 n=1 Tax=Acanthaster planci TaxID=133434 RepID=A0A8B7ZAP6_ACAPL|nr:uncharacterized protein LOC110985369 [Acanthaster planci]